MPGRLPKKAARHHQMEEINDYTLRAAPCRVAFALPASAFAAPAYAQDKTAKIGVLNGHVEPLCRHRRRQFAWPRSRWRSRIPACAKKGWKIDVVSGDHQNKPDVGVNIARQWIDNEKVDVIADTPNSGVALAVSNLVQARRTPCCSTPARRPPI